MCTECISRSTFFFYFTDPAPTKIYTLSLHDALPIFSVRLDPKGMLYAAGGSPAKVFRFDSNAKPSVVFEDRKSTRLNSSHQIISYAVFCLKKKNDTKDALNPDQEMSAPSAVDTSSLA